MERDSSGDHASTQAAIQCTWLCSHSSFAEVVETVARKPMADPLQIYRAFHLTLPQSDGRVFHYKGDTMAPATTPRKRLRLQIDEIPDSSL